MADDGHVTITSSDHSKPNGPVTAWQRDDFAAFRDALPPERLSGDLNLIRTVLKHMGKPRVATVGKAALDWATENGVVVFVDHARPGAGYYFPGTGIVGVSKTEIEQDPVRAAGTLITHIRHAWQDAHGLLPEPEGKRDWTSRYTRLLILKADAAAHGRIAKAEARGNTNKTHWSALASWLQSNKSVKLGTALARTRQSSPTTREKFEFSPKSKPLTTDHPVHTRYLLDAVNRHFSRDERLYPEVRAVAALDAAFNRSRWKARVVEVRRLELSRP